MIRTDPYPDLVELLVAESAAAFAQVQAQHPDEHFYGFGFVSAALFVYLIPVANSEEGLLRQAQQEAKLYPTRPLEESLREMRWRPYGWAYFDNPYQVTPQVVAWHKAHVPDFKNLPWIEYDSYSGDDFYGTETWNQRMFSSMQAALPRIGQQIFPHAAPEVIIDVESEVNFYAVGISPQQHNANR